MPYSQRKRKPRVPTTRSRNQASTVSDENVAPAVTDVVETHVAEESTDSEVSATGTQDSNKRKRSKVSPNLTREEEEAIVEWLREHPEIYDKRKAEYKNQQKKESLWKQKADEMGKDVTVLKVWYKSLRTRMGKLMKTKSGQATTELTDRDNWVLTELEFLRVHIERVHRRPLVSVSIAFNK